MIEIYKRNCPKCGSEIEYKNPRSFKWADRDKKPCRKCYSKDISNTLKHKVKNNEFTPHIRDKNIEITKERNYIRKCPNCNGDMYYMSERSLKKGIYKKTVCNSCSTKLYNKTFNDVINEEHIKKMRATKAGFDSWEEYVEGYPKKQFYKREVWRLTYKNPLNELEHWERRGRCGVAGAHQLDHIQSINWGWENGIPSEVIADWDNLRMIPWKENRDKW
jgi:reverse gyrase